MSKNSAKFISAALSAVTAVSMSGALLFVPAAHAQSTSDLQAQIAALLAQIQQLQSQLNTAQGGSSSSYGFTKDLTLGSTGADVKALQQFLNSHGAQIAASGAGSSGNESTYFGTLTKSALSKWQAANGVSPASGYFGPITRAKVASMGGSTGTGSTGSTGGTYVPAPASGLAVRISSQNPSAGSLISSATSAAARVPVMSVDLTAGNAGGITVSQINFTKTGVVSDSSISGAYLVENGKVVAQYNSVSNGVITFSGLSLGVSAGQTRTLTLAIDPATGLSAGNTIAFSMNAASDVVATDASNNSVTPSGTFPMNSNVFTVTSVSNPSIASLTVASSSIGTSITAGTQNAIVGAWSFTASNSKVYLKSINFKVIGSANKSDLKNVKLYVNGTQVGSTLASVGTNGEAYFDLTSSPATLNTGSSNVQVIADVMGSPSFNFQFEILNSYDVYATDSQYNVPVSTGSNTGTQVSINQGQITVTAASDTPTGNIAQSQSNVTLAKYSIYAAGEAVKVKWLTFSLSFTSPSSTNDLSIKNVRMVDDAGGQLGSTISSLDTSVTCTDHAFSASTSTPYNCFGSSGSPINYIVPANTTRVLSLKGDIQSTATFGTVTASLVASTNSNLQGLTSSQTSNSGAASGSALTLATSALTVAKNTAVGSQTIAKGATEVKIGSYALTASSAEGVTVSNVTILTGAAGASFQNMRVKIGTTQFGNTQPTLAANASYSFAGTAFTVGAGQTTYLDVYADVLSSASAGTKATITTLSGCSASGATSYSAISCTSTAGQDVSVAGQATVQIAVDNTLSPASGQVVMGSSGATLAAFRLTETTNVENVKITDLNVFQTVASSTTVKPAFSNLRLYKSTDLNTSLASAGSSNASVNVSSTASGEGYYWQFHFANPVVVTQNGSVSLVLKGDVATYNSSGATDNTTHVFKIATSTDTVNDTIAETVVALGNTSNATSAVTLASGSSAPNANAQTVLRSKATLSATALGTTSGRAKSATDDLANITFAADSAGTVAVNTVTVTFSGTAPSIATFLDGVTLLDANGSNVTNTTGVSVATSAACNGTNTCTKSWNFGATTAGWTISGGQSYAFKLRLDGTKTLAGSNGVSQSLSATVNASTDVTYTDGSDSAATSGINLPTNVVPVNLNSVSFAAGS